MTNKKKIAITLDVQVFETLQALRATQAVNVSGYINKAVAAALKAAEVSNTKKQEN